MITGITVFLRMSLENSYNYLSSLAPPQPDTKVATKRGKSCKKGNMKLFHPKLDR